MANCGNTTTCGNVVTSGVTRGCNDNACHKGQPEFNKPWKRANNSGCCGTCKTIAPCGTTPTNPKGLLPGQMTYIIKTPYIVGTCAGGAPKSGSNGGKPADGGQSIGYSTSTDNFVSKAVSTTNTVAVSSASIKNTISACTSRYNTTQCVKTISGDNTGYTTVCTEINRQPCPPAPLPPIPPPEPTPDPSFLGEPVAEFGQVTLVPAYVITTIVSYTAPTGKTFHLQGFTACGDADAYYKIFVQGDPMISSRSTTAVLTASQTFGTPLEVTEGQSVTLRVTHFVTGLNLNFDGTILGYLT